jgi:PqqD family protein of HPr-rel-A system
MSSDICEGVSRVLICTLAGRALEWEKFADLFIVYQPSSSETHFFNETTALILKCLENGALSVDEVKERTEVALGAGLDELPTEDFIFATMRLEELGLIERMDDASVVK